MNFVNYQNATELMEAINEKFKLLDGAYKFRGSIPFASLPTPAQSNVGYVFNITDAFETDARFIEGAGKKYAAGTDVGIADQSTTSYDAVTPAGSENPKEEGWYEEVSAGVYELTNDTEVDGSKTYYAKTVTPVFKFDVLGNFVDVDGLTDLIDKLYDMIGDEFDDTAAYSTGDIVIYEHVLYQFKADHAAGDWDATEVDAKTVVDLIEAAEPDPLTAQQITNLIAILG